MLGVVEGWSVDYGVGVGRGMMVLVILKSIWLLGGCLYDTLLDMEAYVFG